MIGMNTFAAELKKEVTKFRNAEKRKQEAFMRKQSRQAKAKRTENSPLRNEDFYYTDASKYAKKYYGDTHHYTTHLDNDWD
jgi:hypothetical protein